MKKRDAFIFICIILALILILTLKPDKIDPDQNIIKCIGENSKLYTQLGCHACERQEEIFGNFYQNLNIVDCFFEREKCGEIEATPTWIINGEKIVGIKTIEKLKELTGCSNEI